MDVGSWALRAEVGETLIYAKLNHYDRREATRRVMESARKAHADGLVFLAQKRNHQGLEYQATRISPQTARQLGLLPRRGGD